MPTYSTSSLQCSEHEDCREDKELGLVCALATFERNDQAWTPRHVEVERWVYTLLSRQSYYVGEEQRTPIKVWESCVGRVVDVRVDNNARIMSDVWGTNVYATIARLDGSFDEVYATGEMCDNPRPIVDADSETMARYAAHLEGLRLAREDAEAKRRAVIAEAERKAPRKGKRVRVVRGRKVPKGTEGECVWFGGGFYGDRVGVKDASGVVHWTDAKNVEAVR